MKITLTKKANRNLLVCAREDGTFTKIELGPNLPHHDLAHYVLEKTLGFTDGFFGSVKKGYSVQELSTKEVILTLPPQAMLAEVLVRALGCIQTGSCTMEGFEALVQMELSPEQKELLPALSLELVQTMVKDDEKLLEQWEKLPDNGQLNLEF